MSDIQFRPLPPELAKHLSRARHNNKENQKLLKSLSKRKDLDSIFHKEHEEAFEKIDCLKCANCCKTTSPIFRDVDIERISKHLGMKPAQMKRSTAN